MLIPNWRTVTLIIDSNILLVYFLGRYQPDLIASFKRTSVYDEDDFELIAEIIAASKQILVTPNIMTEVSNLANSLDAQTRIHFFESFWGTFKSLNEEHIPTQDAIQWQYFSKYGVTDSTIAVASRLKKCLVVTDDYKLANVLFKENIPCLNLNTIKETASYQTGKV